MRVITFENVTLYQTLGKCTVTCNIQQRVFLVPMTGIFMLEKKLDAGGIPPKMLLKAQYVTQFIR